MTKPIIDKENLSELAWMSAGDGYECEPDNENGAHTFNVLENIITSSGDWSYWRRVTVSVDGALYQFEAEIDHREGMHDYHDPYPVEAYTETVTKYRKPDSGNQTDRPVQRTPLPATVAPLRGWPDHC